MLFCPYPAAQDVLGVRVQIKQKGNQEEGTREKGGDFIRSSLIREQPLYPPHSHRQQWVESLLMGNFTRMLQEDGCWSPANCSLETESVHSVCVALNST